MNLPKARFRARAKGDAWTPPTINWWNSLSQEVEMATNIDDFKGALDNFMEVWGL